RKFESSWGHHASPPNRRNSGQFLRNSPLYRPLPSTDSRKETIMKSGLNNTCISAVLCSAVLMALPALAAGVGGTPGGGIGVGATTGTAGTSLGTGVNTTGQVATPAGTLNDQANANINAATALNTNGVGGSV